MEEISKIRIEIQHFEGCPNSPIMIKNVKDAMNGIENYIILSEINIADDETAKNNSFRGSPTLLINGKDFENMTVPRNPNLSCRFYINGLPSAVDIKKRIYEELQIPF
jgi:hypothetical protein